MSSRKIRVVRKTILVVGEGLAEVALAQQLKATYTRDGNGCAMTIRNARGKGGRHVIDYAARQMRASEFTTVCAVLDTDTDWDQEVEAIARRSGIEVVANDPCLEAMLLRVHGVAAGRTTADCKRLFKDRFGGEAHDAGIISRHFQRGHLDGARGSVESLDRLMTLIEI